MSENAYKSIWRPIDIFCKSGGIRVITMVEAINGNVNHLSKSEILHYSCEVSV